MQNSLITQRVQELESSYQDYILSGEIKNIAGEFSQAHDLDTDESIALENGLILFFLFFIDKESLVNFIVKNCNIEPESASILVDAVTMVIPVNILEIHKRTSLLVFNDGGQNQIGGTNESALPVLRTMEDDSKEGIVHASSQETLLKKEIVSPAPSKIPPPPST